MEEKQALLLNENNLFSKIEKSNFRKQVDDLLFGSIAGMVGKFAEYPFDTIKVRLQTQPLDKPHFTGPWDCFKTLMKQEGFKGLYIGMSSPLVGSMIENAALFVGYRQIQRWIRDYSSTNWRDIAEEDLPPLEMNQLVLAGTASGAIASIVLTPVELIKCKLQVQIGAPTQLFSGPFHVVQHVLRSHGPSGFYRGFLATLLREAGGGAFWFGSYEYVCAQFVRKHQKDHPEFSKKDLSPVELMIGGGLGGMAYNASLFPVDVIKSHMQTDERFKTQRSFGQTAREIYKVGGYKAFYRGCGITVARSAPTSAIIFLTYELLNRHFGS
ncbi:hypothetical protein G6F56_005231 [Rhizopus delemar]|uniref:Amino-acid transporter arg-13 n=1 Tax=Rhizopus stolonifer TaxID=4846 RepID=A0A367KSI0_RHIST|nr:hypothetical protein G6F56_005231 [Rhizopus delemar]RCI04812.1 hypothetical protein CU098_009639 [Rhizopus stolonifer]